MEPRGPLSLSYSHVTSRKHWHKRQTHTFSLFLPRLNRLFVFYYNATTGWQGYMYFRGEKKWVSCAHTQHISLVRSLHSLTLSSNSGGIQQETVSLVTVTGSDFFFLPCALSSLCFYFSVLSEWVIEKMGGGQTLTKAWQCTVLLLSGKHGWVVCSSVITNVKELFISSNPFLYSPVCLYTHTHRWH